MKKAKILVVAPYEGMRELLTGIAEQRQDVDLTIMNCSIKDINQLMSNPEISGYSAIVSRGETAKRIKELTHQPVAEIPISAFDVLRAIKLAQNFDGEFAIVGDVSITKVAKLLCDTLQYDINILTVDQYGDQYHILNELMRKNCYQVVGDSGTVMHARELGMNGILIISGYESVDIALNHALMLSAQREQNKHDLEILNALLEYNPLRIIAMNTAGDICYSNIPVDTQNLYLPNIRRQLPKVLTSGFVDQTYRTDDTIHYLHGSRMTFAFDTIAAFFIRSAVFSLASKKECVQVLQRENVQQLFINSFFNSFGIFPDEVYVMARQIGNKMNPILIWGEEGTGKEYLAMYIYLNSSLKNNSFIMIDCSKIKKADWNALLKDSSSPFCNLNTTFFFSNIDEDTMRTVLGFLKGSVTLQRNQFIFTYTTYGSNLPNSTTVRDFINMLNCMLIRLPPLRERADVLPNLLSLAIISVNAQSAKNVIGFNADAIEYLRNCSWPQNLDQFLRVVKQSILLCTSTYVSEETVRYVLDQECKLDNTVQTFLDSNHTLDEMVKDIVLSVFHDENMNQSRTAKRLGISRTTLWRMLK